MKKAAAAVLVLAIILSLNISVQATDERQGVRVSNLDELLEAIDMAQDGDTIILTEEIPIFEDTVIGSTDKMVNLVVDSEFSMHFFNVGGGNVTLLGLSLDGRGESGVMNCNSASLTCIDCTFYRCRGGIDFYSSDGTFTDCQFESCHSPISGALDLSMQNCSIVNCTGIFTCVSARGNVEIRNCRFEECIVSVDTGVLFLSLGSARITNSVFRGNRALLGRGGAIFSDADITISGCVFMDNFAGIEGSDLYMRTSSLTITDDAQELTELYEAQSYDYTGLYLDYIDERQVNAVNLPYSDEAETLALCFTASEHVEPAPAPEPVIVTEYVTVPVYITDTVEVEKIVEVEIIVEVEPPKETVELNDVTLERNDDYLSGYFSALKGKNATRADVAQILYHLTKHDGTDVAADYGYTDVSASAPYAEAVNALSNAGLFNGCGNGLFAPDETMTKAQVLVVLDRLLGLEPVQDATGHWSMPYLRAAQACGFAGDMTVQELDEAISMVEVQEMIDYLFSAAPP